MSSSSELAQALHAGLSSEVSCHGKVSFESRALAQSVAGRPTKSPRPPRSAYRCRHCGFWHVGSDSGRIRRHKAAEWRKARGNDIE